MNINLTLYGEVVFILAVIFSFLTIRYARGKAQNLPLVGFYAVLLNIFIPPCGWVYCIYWAHKENPQKLKSTF